MYIKKISLVTLQFNFRPKIFMLNRRFINGILYIIIKIVIIVYL